MSRARFTNSAEADLLEMWLTIAEENLVAADESLDSIKTTALLLATQPEMGRASSLSDLKEIGCKFDWTVHISPLFWSIE